MDNLFRLEDMPIDASYISQRDKGGTTLSYLEGHRVIQNLNELFPYEWSFVIKDFQHTYTRDIVKKSTNTAGNASEKRGWEVGARCIGRLEIKMARNIVVRPFEDVGYGMGTDYNSPLNAEESAGKEAVTDALKRCAKNLGNYFGLALYDKEQEAVLSMDKDGWAKLYKLTARYCDLKTQQKIVDVLDSVKAKYGIKLPDDMKPFMWREVIRDAFPIYWTSFLQQQGARYGRSANVQQQTAE